MIQKTMKNVFEGGGVNLFALHFHQDCDHFNSS